VCAASSGPLEGASVPSTAELCVSQESERPDTRCGTMRAIVQRVTKASVTGKRPLGPERGALVLLPILVESLKRLRLLPSMRVSPFSWVSRSTATLGALPQRLTWGRRAFKLGGNQQRWHAACSWLVVAFSLPPVRCLSVRPGCLSLNEDSF